MRITLLSNDSQNQLSVNHSLYIESAETTHCQRIGVRIGARSRSAMGEPGSAGIFCKSRERRCECRQAAANRGSRSRLFLWRSRGFIKVGVFDFRKFVRVRSESASISSPRAESAGRGRSSSMIRCHTSSPRNSGRMEGKSSASLSRSVGANALMAASMSATVVMPFIIER